MNKIRTSDFVGYALALLLLFVVMAPSAIAKHEPEQPADSVTVVGHLPLPGGPVSQLFMQEHGGKQYLYIQQASEQGLTIVDVTEPFRPNVVNRLNLPISRPERNCRWSGLAWPSLKRRKPEKKALALNLRPGRGMG